MKVHLLMGAQRKLYFGAPEVRAVYASRKEANAEAKRLLQSPYTNGHFWVESKTVKGETK